MIAYVIRRVMYAIPILIGVNLITFTLFFVVNPPDNMARLHLGLRHVTDASIEKWKSQYGYDKPLIINYAESGLATLTETVFFHKSVKLFVFDFGVSDNGRDISYDISQRMWPSLAIAVPSLMIALMVNISFALLLSFFRGSYIDLWGGGVLRHDDVNLCFVLLYWRPIFDWQIFASGPHLRI